MKDQFENVIGPMKRFLLGILLILPWILQGNNIFKLIEFSLLIILTLIAGKKLKWGYFILFILSISFFHLLTPQGKVIIDFFGFPLTIGALSQGLFKGITLIGLILISLFSVKPGLHFPGKMGGLLGRMFYYYEEIMKSQKNLRPGKIIVGLDDAMLQLNQPSPKKKEENFKNQPFAIIILLLINLLFWVLFIFNWRFN
jgi:hypothetical protein